MSSGADDNNQIKQKQISLRSFSKSNFDEIDQIWDKPINSPTTVQFRNSGFNQSKILEMEPDATAHYETTYLSTKNNSDQ